jgi:hypothetical protein
VNYEKAYKKIFKENIIPRKIAENISIRFQTGSPSSTMVNFLSLLFQLKKRSVKLIDRSIVIIFKKRSSNHRSSDKFLVYTNAFQILRTFHCSNIALIFKIGDKNFILFSIDVLKLFIYFYREFSCCVDFNF